MKKENLDNQEVYKTTEQIRQSSEYAWLVDSLDISFNDNLWTGLSAGGQSVDKFMEAVFGREQARAISEDVKRQFYEDYLSKIQELKLGKHHSNIKTEKSIENIQKSQSEVSSDKKESGEEFYKDIDKFPETKKIHDQMVDFRKLIPDMPPVPKYSLEYKGWLNNLKDRIVINKTKIRTEQYKGLIEKYNILCEQFLSLFDKGLQAQEIINKIHLEQERKNLIQLQIENEKAVLLAKIKESKNIIAENQAKIDKIKTVSKGQPVEIKETDKEGKKEVGDRDVMEDWEKRKEDLLDKVRNGKKTTTEVPTLTDWKKLNQELTDYLGSSFQDIAAKDKPELLDKTVKAIDGLWRYFADSGRWQKTVDKKRNNQPIVYLKDTSDSNAKAVLLLIKKTGLENALLNNWIKPELTSDNEELKELNNGLAKAAQETSSAEVLYKVLQEQGILKNKDEALRVMVDLATKSMHYDLIKTKEDWHSSNLSLRGLHRALNQQQEYLYVKERINRFLELKKWRLPLNKKQQVELDGELLNEPVDKTLLEKIINNGKKEEVLLKLDKVGQEQASIIKQADQVLNKSDEELIKNNQLIVTADWGRLFLNQHKRGDKSFGGAVAARAYGFDGFINYDTERGGYLITSFKPKSDLLANIDLPGALKVNKQMVMRPGNGGEKVSLEQLLKAVVPEYSLSGESQIKSKEVQPTQEKFEYSGLQFSRALNQEELAHLNILDAEVKEYITESVSQVIKQKYSHLNPVEQSVLLKDQIANGMNHPKILEQRKSKCLAANLPLIIDK